MMTSLAERAFWNRESYGSAWLINRRTIVAAYTVLAIAIPVVVPVWLAPLLWKWLPVTVRWNL